MSDIVAHLEVLSQQSGCILDLTTILNAAICPSLNIKSFPQYQWQDKGDTVCVTPSAPTQQYKRNDECYTVPEEVCQQNTVGLDLELAVLLGLLTDEELEKYLQACGSLPPDCTLPGGGNGPSSVEMNPLLSLTVGGPGELANLNVGGRNGLLNLDVGKNGNLLSLDLNGKPVLDLRRRADKLANVEVGGPTKTDGAINVNLLTHGSGNEGYGNGNGAGYSNDDGHYLSWYQPICKKRFAPEHRSRGENCHANDVNHCLAICHAQAALVTIGAEVNVERNLEVLVCAAVEFDQSTPDNNCYYYVAPESEPCQESQLEPDDNCYTFFRN